MDIAVFKASKKRLRGWILIPPMIIITLGLGTHALSRKAHWHLQSTQVLNDKLPAFIQSNKGISTVLDEFRDIAEGQSQEGQVIAVLQDEAVRSGFEVTSVQVDRLPVDLQTDKLILNAAVSGYGTLESIQKYLKNVNTARNMLAEDVIKISEADEDLGGGIYEAKIIFKEVLFKSQSTGKEPSS